MATFIIHHGCGEAHPSPRSHADTHFAPVPLGWTVIGRRRRGAEQRNFQTGQRKTARRQKHSDSGVYGDGNHQPWLTRSTRKSCSYTFKMEQSGEQRRGQNRAGGISCC